MNFDANATGLLGNAFSKHTTCGYYTVELELIKDMFVNWRNKKTLNEMLEDGNIPDHEKTEKLRKINLVKKAVLENIYTDTTIFGMRKDTNTPIVIIDGIHRAIGIQRAFAEDPTIRDKVTLRILLVEGNNMTQLPDYSESIL